MSMSDGQTKGAKLKMAPVPSEQQVGQRQNEGVFGPAAKRSVGETSLFYQTKWRKNVSYCQLKYIATPQSLRYSPHIRCFILHRTFCVSTKLIEILHVCQFFVPLILLSWSKLHHCPLALWVRGRPSMGFQNLLEWRESYCTDFCFVSHLVWCQGPVFQLPPS